jgi:hypothetical protein
MAQKQKNTVHTTKHSDAGKGVVRVMDLQRSAIDGTSC